MSDTLDAEDTLLQSMGYQPSDPLALMNDPKWVVRHALACKIPEDLTVHMSKDPDWCVRRAVARRIPFHHVASMYMVERSFQVRVSLVQRLAIGH